MGAGGARRGPPEPDRLLKSLHPELPRDDASMTVLLLQTERLADALAEGEFKDMGFARKTAW
jgi:hypothetical protein